MPSIRIRSAHYPDIRDVFTNLDPNTADDQTSDHGSPDPSSTPGLQSLSPQSISMQALSLSDMKAGQGQVSAPSSPTTRRQVADSPNIPQRRPRSNTASSRIRTHVLDRRSRDSRFYRDSMAGNPSSEALNPQHDSSHPTRVRVEGAQADLFVESQTGDIHSILEDALNDDAQAPQSGRRRTFTKNHHDDIVEHLDCIGEGRHFFQ